mgnify:FL=1
MPDPTDISPYLDRYTVEWVTAEVVMTVATTDDEDDLVLRYTIDPRAWACPRGLVIDGPWLWVVDDGA